MQPTSGNAGGPLQQGKSHASDVNSTKSAANATTNLPHAAAAATNLSHAAAAATNLSHAAAATTNVSTIIAATSDTAAKSRQALTGFSVCVLVLVAALTVQARSEKAMSSTAGLREQSSRSRSRLLQAIGRNATEAQQQEKPGEGDLAGVALEDRNDSAGASGGSAPQGEDRRPGDMPPPEMNDESDELSFTNERALQGVKLLVVLFGAMALTRLVVCDHYQLECDTRYTFSLFMRQDIHKVVLDIVFLFVVGRIGSASPLPVDSATFIIVVCVSALIPSWLNELDFMKHSLSMFEVMCSWTFATWLFAVSACGITISLGLAHLWYFSQRAQHRRRAAVELLVVFAIFVLPRAFQPGYHMHHWYVMWLLALPCRAPALWSRAAQAVLIGGYVNGVAIYGRDPVLACQAAFDLAYNEQCQFYLQCTAPPAGAAPGAGPAPAHYTPPDWRTCKAGDYS